MPTAKSTIPVDAAPTLFKNAKAFETWLKKHHAASDGLWLMIAKRGADEPSVTIEQGPEGQGARCDLNGGGTWLAPRDSIAAT